MITITGGKLTTWRRMAKETVDRIVWRDGSETKCRTHAVPLGMPVDPADLVLAPEASREQLASRYGHLAHDVLAQGRIEPILAARPDLMAEVVYAARREQARTVGDVLLRRTRLGLTAARPLLGSDAVERVAAVLGGELGWDDARVAREAAAFRDEAVQEGILPGP
jgi:glycerol-3-phosphate dehydrogenase